MEETDQIPKWECSIRKANNGFIIAFTEENIAKEVVFEIDDSEDENLSEKKAFQKLVWDLMDYFAVYNSKHEKHRLAVEIVEQK